MYLSNELNGEMYTYILHCSVELTVTGESTL